MLNMEPGDTIILKQESLLPQFQDVEHRTVEVLGGFGTKSYLSGNAIFVRFPDGEEARVSRYDVDVEATKAYWEEHGRVTQ